VLEVEGMGRRSFGDWILLIGRKGGVRINSACCDYPEAV